MSGKLERLRAEMAGVRSRRYKLLFLLPETASASAIAGEMEREGIAAINVSLLLSDKLRHVAPDKRPYEVAKHVKQAINGHINEYKADVVCLYHIEYLFDLELKQNPIKLLEALSGNIVLLVAWPGGAEQGVLYYADPEHPEYDSNGEYGSCILPY
ncbi:BREX-3 system P-loop-containing protein BrxF [Paenibacillus contaminans]|uniref:BREX-3 system P-loop-containing protein BrxF n=1 Tax=Paenibacillus contaminans TaxID=450362 RepID=A0A329MIN9_9BACL|nr:BREX-3 system P-loop-containing protein BrxF [Paenibacillus contaminans]RAV19675.1 BREX-3 system P-loop-containing protein BrxF [Paenibacillus contaminans]